MRILRKQTKFDTHRIGSFYKSHIYPIVYIPIPKNASTWASLYFREILKWGLYTEETMRNEMPWLVDISSLKFHKKLVILNDPVERWIRGVSQYLTTAMPDLVWITDKDFMKFIYTHVLFDTHTLPQVNFLHNLNTEDMDFLKMDKNLERNLSEYLKQYIPEEFVSIPDDLFKNKTPLDSNKFFLNERFKQLTNTDPKYKQMIIDMYEEDYKLISNIKFYEAN